MKTLFLDLKGRIGRGAFWLGWTILLVGSAACYLGASFAPSVLQTLVYFAGLTVLLFPKIALFAKRFHDIGWPGWPAAILLTLYDGQSVIGFFLTGVALNAAEAEAGGPIGAVATREISAQATERFLSLPLVGPILLVSFLMFLIAALAPGQRKDNRHGAMRSKEGRPPSEIAAAVFD